MNAVAPLIPCIVSGGSGTRLWPVSRESMPKPFMRLADDQSLLQKTFLRIAGLPDVARLLGSEGDAGKDLQLPRDWVVQMVRQVGNYGEIFARNVGDGSPLKMPRGLNAQWNLGGLHYAPPIR